MSSKQAQKSYCKEFSYWAHEPLRNGKKTIQAFESLNSDVRVRSKAQITILGPYEQDTSLWAHKYLINSKKNLSVLGIAQFWCLS